MYDVHTGGDVCIQNTIMNKKVLFNEKKLVFGIDRKIRSSIEIIRPHKFKLSCGCGINLIGSIAQISDLSVFHKFSIVLEGRELKINCKCTQREYVKRVRFLSSAFSPTEKSFSDFFRSNFSVDLETVTGHKLKHILFSKRTIINKQ